MFQANEAVSVNIIVNGERIAVPGITTGDEYTADRVSRTTGSPIPTQYVDVITYHDVPASQSRNGNARKYWKHQRQSAAFMEYRIVAVPELDNLTAQELLAEVQRSLAEVQQTSVRVRTALIENAADAVKPKAVFGQTTLGLGEPVAAK